jgi:hypothetical protein
MKSCVWKSPPNCSLSLANAAASDWSIDRCADSSVVLMPSGPHAAIVRVEPVVDLGPVDPDQDDLAAPLDGDLGAEHRYHRSINTGSHSGAAAAS